MFTSELLNWHSYASRVLQARPGSRKDTCLWSRTYFIWKLPNASTHGSCTHPLAKTGMVSVVLLRPPDPLAVGKMQPIFNNTVRISDTSRNEGLVKVLIFHVRSLSVSVL